MQQRSSYLVLRVPPFNAILKSKAFNCTYVVHKYYMICSMRIKTFQLDIQRRYWQIYQNKMILTADIGNSAWSKTYRCTLFSTFKYFRGLINLLHCITLSLELPISKVNITLSTNVLLQIQVESAKDSNIFSVSVTQSKSPLCCCDRLVNHQKIRWS